MRALSLVGIMARCDGEGTRGSGWELCLLRPSETAEVAVGQFHEPIEEDVLDRYQVALRFGRCKMLSRPAHSKRGESWFNEQGKHAGVQ